MIVSWGEVPCNGRNGPITGYYLTYTNITSNTSYTVNITGGNNRMYTLTGLIPYTSYTVSIIPYNYNEVRPISANVTQQTLESGKDNYTHYELMSVLIMQCLVLYIVLLLMIIVRIHWVYHGTHQ